MRFVDSLDILTSTNHIQALNESSVVQHFEPSNAIEIRDRITFDFYTGLSHINSHVPCYVHN